MSVKKFVRFVIQHVKIGLLEAGEYQRDRKPSIVSRIVADFNPLAVGIPVVSLRGGVYYVVDGCHRVEALRSISGENTEIIVQLYTDLSYEEEVRLFLDLNNGIKPDPLDRFNARIVLADPSAVELLEFVQKLGYEIRRPATAVSGGQSGISGIQEVESTFKSNPVGLEMALTFTRRVFPGEASPSAYLLSGLAKILPALPPTFNLGLLERYVSSLCVPSGSVKKMSETAAANNGVGGQLTTDSRGGLRIAQGLVLLYNNSLKGSGRKRLVVSL